MPQHAELLPGNLDVVILNAVSLGAIHGYGVSPLGRRRFGEEKASWNRLAAAIALSATPREI